MKRKLRQWVVLMAFICVFLVDAPNAYAADGYKTVRFDFLVDGTMRGKEMCIYLLNDDTGDLCTVTTTGYKEASMTESLPYGTYELSRVTFDGDWDFNYEASMGCGTITVSDVGVSYGNGATSAVISVTRRVVINRGVDVTFSAEYENDGACTVQLWLSGETDAEYANGPSGTNQKEDYCIVIPDGGTVRTIDAGTYQVSDIRAYGADGETLSVYYPGTITIGRYDEDDTVSLYVFDDTLIRALSDARLADLRGMGYRVKLASETGSWEIVSDGRTRYSYGDDTKSAAAAQSAPEERETPPEPRKLVRREDSFDWGWDDASEIEGWRSTVRAVRVTALLALFAAAIFISWLTIRRRYRKYRR